jgi:hypothetical protein
MKSHSLKLVVLAFLLTTSSALVVAQDQTSSVDKLTQPEAKARVQSAVTSKRVKTLVASAKTPEDHMRLAAYFNQEADRMEADAKGHEELAGVYRQNPSTFVSKGGGPGIFRTAEHCDSAAKSLREAAKSLRDLAAEHEQMAKDVGK